jgi:hypothetical protein
VPLVLLAAPGSFGGAAAVVQARKDIVLAALIPVARAALRA